MPKEIKATQALLDANGHLDVVPGDTILARQVVAPVTQAMLDADPELGAAGVKVGDFLNEGKSFSISVTGKVTPDGGFHAIVTGDAIGNATGIINTDGTFSGKFDGPVDLG